MGKANKNITSEVETAPAKAKGQRWQWSSFPPCSLAGRRLPKTRKSDWFMVSFNKPNKALIARHYFIITMTQWFWSIKHLKKITIVPSSISKNRATVNQKNCPLFFRFLSTKTSWLTGRFLFQGADLKEACGSSSWMAARLGKRRCWEMPVAEADFVVFSAGRKTWNSSNDKCVF